ncbi:MAG: ArsR/SmtB family transcription factor [Dorea sp.]
MNIDYVEYAKIFKVLSDAKRLKIINMLSNGELCACKILEEFQITQPTLSHDMKLLCETGLVNARKEGKWMHYSLNMERMNEIYKIVGKLMIPSEFEKLIDCDCNK